MSVQQAPGHLQGQDTLELVIFLRLTAEVMVTAQTPRVFPASITFQRAVFSPNDSCKVARLRFVSLAL